jgi:hypothetical protein
MHDAHTTSERIKHLRDEFKEEKAGAFEATKSRMFIEVESIRHKSEASARLLSEKVTKVCA